MGKETEKVRRWREQQRIQGRRSLTLWLEGETVERLHARAQTLGVTVPDLIVRMVTDTVTATTENEVTDTITVTSLTLTDTLRQAIRDELGHALTQVADTLTATVRETVQHALSEVTVTDTTAKVTDAVTDTTRKARALTAEGLANAAMALHQQDLSYEQIARQWDAEGYLPSKAGGGIRALSITWFSAIKASEVQQNLLTFRQLDGTL